MDKQGRLTRKDEWIPGAKYRWKKGRFPGREVITFQGFDGTLLLYTNAEGENCQMYYRHQIGRWIPDISHGS